MKYSERESKSIFTINKMNAHRDLFDDCIWKEKESFEKVFHKLRDNHNEQGSVTVEESNLKAEKNKLEEDGYELFKVCKGVVKIREPKAFKLYLIDFKSKNTNGDLKRIYSALSNTLIIAKNEQYNSLNNFEGEIEATVNKISLFLSEKAEKLVELENASKDKKSIEDEWDEEYKSLKRYLKAFFTKKKGIDYKIFFEEKKSKKSKSNSKELENNNETEEDLNVKEDVLEDLKEDLEEIKENILEVEKDLKEVE